MKRALPALLLVLSACAAEPPERGALPDVQSVLGEPTGCLLNVGEPAGARIDDVIEGTAADGILEVDDIILEIDGDRTPTATTLIETAGAKSVGDAVTMTVNREGQTLNLDLTLGANPTDLSSPQIGILIRTTYETIAPTEVTGPVAPSRTTRSIGLGSDLLVFDPLSGAWQNTNLEVSAEINWVATNSGYYAITSEEGIITDLATGSAVQDDGFLQWEPRRLIGSLGESLLIVVTADVPDQPGFITIAIANFDPITGETAWATPVLRDFGLPVAAYTNHDASNFVVLGVDRDTGAETGISLFDSNGTLLAVADLLSLGRPVGWFDEETMAFRSTDEVISIHRLEDGRTETHPVPPDLVEAPLLAVGDGVHMLGIDGRTLVIEDITGGTETRILAENCSIGQIGQPASGL